MPIFFVTQMLALLSVVGLLAPAARAAVTTFGSPLTTQATLNTSENLDYEGINTPLPGFVFHTPHYGADTALWNTVIAGGQATAPESGQVVKVALEGCAQEAQGGPAPLTQIHFQVLSPQAGGGAKVELTSQSFEIPICGQNGASGATVSDYEPINLCVSQGDYVAFNDEGGYVENVYRSGVPYQVIGAVQGSTMDSFIRGGGTGNGATFSPSERSAGEGFAGNENEELMLQATLASGAEATPVCGGTQGETPPPKSVSGTTGRGGVSTRVKPLKLLAQRDHIDHRRRRTTVSFYCELLAGCDGTIVLSSLDYKVRYGILHFAVTGAHTDRLTVSLDSAALAALRRHRGRLTVELTSLIDGQYQHQLIALRGS